MITVKYPDWVEEQIKRIDEEIARIYAEELLETEADKARDIREFDSIEYRIYQRVKPLEDRKVELMMNSVPTYFVDKDEVIRSEDFS